MVFHAVEMIATANSNSIRRAFGSTSSWSNSSPLSLPEKAASSHSAESNPSAADKRSPLKTNRQVESSGNAVT